MDKHGYEIFETRTWKTGIAINLEHGLGKIPSKFSRVEERFRAFLTVTVPAGSGLPKSSKIVITAEMSKIGRK